jgi:site-specific recombinase XerD
MLAAADAAGNDPQARRDPRRAVRARRDHVLACLLLLNGLRVSEALALDVEDLSTVRSHRVARVRRKGGRHQDVALAPRTTSALDEYLARRGPASGPLLVTQSGERLDRWAAWKVIRGLARAAGVEHAVFPQALRHGFVTAALDAGVPLHRVQDAAGHRDPRTTRRYDRARGALDNHATYLVATYFT